MPGIVSLAGRTSVYKVLHDNTPVYADRPDRSRARSSSSTTDSSSNGYNNHASSSSASSVITYPPQQTSLKVKIALVLRRGDLVEVWNDRVVLVGNVDKSASAKQALLLRRRQRPDSNNISNMRFAPLTNDIGWISLSDSHLQVVDIARHPVQAFYVDNYPVGQCGLRQPIDRPEFRHFGCCASTLIGRRHHHHNHYVPGQVVFSCRSVKQGRATYYRLQRVPFPSASASSSSSSSKTSTVTDSVWLVDSRPREAHEEHSHDDVTLLMPFDKVKVEGGPFAYACVRSIELRTRPDHSNTSRSGRYLLKGDVCVASLIRQSPFNYGNGPFGLLSSHTGLWCFEKINNSPPLLVPLEVERGDWKMQVRWRAPLPVLRQPVRQPLVASLLLPPGPSLDEHTEEEDEEEEGTLDGAAVVDATGSAHVVRVLRRDEVVRSDARFESPATGTWFYRVVGLAWDHTDDASDDDGMDDLVSDDVEVGWVPDRSPTGRRLLVEVRDEASPEDDQGGLANGDAGNTNAHQPWSIDFVRGVAAIASRTVREVSAQPDRQRLVFLQGSIMIHVFVATHTVEIEESTSQTIVQQRHCTPHQLSLILKDPLEALRSRSNASSNVSITTELDPTMSHDDEMTIRQRLADCDDALEGALEKRREILEVLRPVEPMRRDEAIARLGGMESMELDATSIPNPSPPPSGPDSVSMVVYNTSSSSPPPPLAGPALDDFDDDANHRSDASSTPTGPNSMIEYNATSSTAAPPLKAQAQDKSLSSRHTAVSWEDMPRNASNPPSEKNWELAPTPTIHNSSRKRLETPEAPSEPMKPLKEEEQQYDNHDDDRSAASSNDDDNASSDDGTALSSLGEQLNRTCGVCNAFFETARARSVHCLKEHGKFSCNYCPEVFDYVTLLHRHRDQENHW
jgi:hypothetical protein